MKKIINGKRYDTDSADLLGSYDSGGYVNDFSHWEASLYRTKRSKAYFLAGSGGPMTRYAVSAGQNGWRGGKDITPMTKKEAMEWAEEYLDLDEVEKAFSDEIEDA